MPELADLSRPGALPVLARLAVDEPLQMKDFVKATGLYFTAAARLREDMRAWGLIRIEEYRHEGRLYMNITLTEHGRKIGGDVLQLSRHLASPPTTPD